MQNGETWYYVSRNTSPTGLDGIEDLLQTVPIQTTRRLVQIRGTNGTTLSAVPFSVPDLVLVLATKIYVPPSVGISSINYTLRVISTSGTGVTLYVLDGSTNTINSEILEGDAGEVRTTIASLSTNNEYTVALVVTNPTSNQSLFVSTSATGTYLPRIKAYVGGTGEVAPAPPPPIITGAAVGDFKHSAQTEDFDGWLLCDGREVPRAFLPELFSIIGTSFGHGDGVNTFNLPDARGAISGSVGQSFDTLLGEEVIVGAAGDRSGNTLFIGSLFICAFPSVAT
jgi:hypothetical protein